MNLKNDPILLLMMMAAAADGEVDNIERARLSNNVSYYPHWKQSDFDDASLSQLKDECGKILLEFNSQMDSIKFLAAQVPFDQREMALAFAFEICASNFILNETESNFLRELSGFLGVSSSICLAIETSIKLRFFTQNEESMRPTFI
jgi:uncharacterized membrane protein YebE (DUF533 family)